MTDKERIKELINRKPSKWGNLTIYEFERDIKILQEQAERAQDYKTAYEIVDMLARGTIDKVNELKQQNKRYREVIEKIKKTSDDYRAGHLLDIQDSFFVDEIIAIINNLEGDLE